MLDVAQVAIVLKSSKAGWCRNKSPTSGSDNCGPQSNGNYFLPHQVHHGVVVPDADHLIERDAGGMTDTFRLA